MTFKEKQNTVEMKKQEKAHQILLIDDDETMQGELKELLESEGYVVELFSDATDALESIKNPETRKDFSAIISDQRMKYLTGVDFFIYLEEHELLPFTPRLIITAFDNIDTIKKAINEAHIFGFILKNSEKEEKGEKFKELKKIIDSAIKRYELITSDLLRCEVIKDKSERIEALKIKGERLEKLVYKYEEKIPREELLSKAE